MTEQDDLKKAVQDQIDVSASKRAKYGHPDPDRTERPDDPTLGFVRWVQKGGHLDPAAEEQHPEYLAQFKKLGGDDAGVTLDDEAKTRVERARAGEVPPANREHPTTDPENAEIEAGAKVLKTGHYEDAIEAPGDKPKKDEKPQGLTKANTPKTVKSTPAPSASTNRS